MVLPVDHWSVTAARRVAALGLAPVGFDASQRAPTQVEIGRLLHHADSVAAERAPAVASLLAGWRRRFADEFGGDGTGWRDALAGSRLDGGYASSEGRLATGWGYMDGHPSGSVWRPPEPIADESGAFVEPSVQAALRDRAGARLTWRADAPETGLVEATGAVRWGNVAIWGGRRRIGFGPGRAGAVVLNDVQLDGAGIQTVSPFRLPGLLRWIGPIELDFGLAQEDLQRSFEDAWFFTGRGSIAPHPRLGLGVTRGVFFGGEGNTDLDWFALFSVLIGKHAGDGTELDNHLVAVDVSFRAPTERWLPATFYAEWGFEDSAGAWMNVPGIVAGVTAPAIPRLPELALTLEYATFSRSCCANPRWYRHVHFQDGWTQDATPLGHPLGGHGSQWSGVADASLFDARMNARVEVFARRRGDENLYDPVRTGDSRGVTASLEAGTGAWRTLVAASHEGGDGWHETQLSVGLRALLQE
ncbi:MAG TPA: capsule assembly Wzi family protein [Longimicrobiales bacterium]